jgi:hypothetical protein
MSDRTTIQFEGGDIFAAAEPLTITGLLLPFNEVGRTNVGRFQVEAGSVYIPNDAAVIGLNTDHVRHDVVGRAISLEQKPEGVFATLKFADTKEGRDAYADAINPNGKRRKLSAEFGPAFIQAGKLVAGHAKLWGAALVEAGAFPSAQVLAADTPPADIPAAANNATDQSTTPDAPTETTASVVDQYTDEAGKKFKRTKVTTTRTEPATDGGTKTTITEKTVLEEPDATAPTNSQEVPAVGVPNTLASGTAPATTNPRAVDLKQVYAAIGSLKSNPGDVEAHQVLADLTDVTFTGTDALPTTGVLRPNWLGELEAGSPYEREYIGLSQLGTEISAAGKSGFKVKRGTAGSPIAGPSGIPNGGNWAGNKAAINSYTGRTEVATSSTRRFAVGQDIAREFYDLPGGAEVVESFLKLVVEDHLCWSDTWALYDMGVAAGLPITPATYPTDYPNALGMLIQGILAVKKRKTDGRRDVPTYAIANDEAYSELVYAAGGAEHLPEFVSIAISTNSAGTVDGNIQVVQGDTGIYGSNSVLVGAKRAIQFDELAGGPLIVNALELAKGGIDRAVHGYLQTFPVREEGVVLIGTAPARVNSTAYVLGTLIKASAVVYRVVEAGTTDSSAPTAPAVGATVEDGSAILLRLV